MMVYVERIGTIGFTGKMPQKKDLNLPSHRDPRHTTPGPLKLELVSVDAALRSSLPQRASQPTARLASSGKI